MEVVSVYDKVMSSPGNGTRALKVSGYLSNSDSETDSDGSCLDIPPVIPNDRRTSLQHKDVRKEGFLYKQGGVDRNQGWKKRWFVFDAKALKYYKDNKSRISLRIIPVAIMQSVAPVNESQQLRISGTDLFGASNRQHKFALACSRRTFLFGTDNLDYCQQWQSCLMAAIIDYQKTNTQQYPHGGEMCSPDISGSAKVDGIKRFLVLKENRFRYYYNEEDYAIDSAIHELVMDMTRAKDINKTTLQLDSPPDQRFMLTFNSESEAMRWKTYLENSTANALGDDTILQKVRITDGNSVCADCGASDAFWASINLAIVLCPKCAGHHRGLGVNRSKVQSLRMDNIFKEKDSVLQLLHVIGNRNANMFWMKDPANSRVIDQQTPDIIRKKHIKEKYTQKKFADIVSCSSDDEVNKTLVAAVKNEDVLSAMKCLFSGADINFRCEGQSKSAIELASECNNIVLREFLEQNRNTDVSALEEEQVSVEDSRKHIYHEGYLEKTGPNLKGFLKRWCVLHYRRLTYFDNERGSNEKGNIDLTLATSVSVPAVQRKHCFDLNAKGRTYRFAASDGESYRNWITQVINVISPFDSCFESELVVAGYYYYKTHTSTWQKIWMYLTGKCINIRPLHNDCSTITFKLSRDVKCLQFNVGKHADNATVTDDLRILNGNHTIELIPPEMDSITHLQGLISRDTKYLFSMLEAIISN